MHGIEDAMPCGEVTKNRRQIRTYNKYVNSHLLRDLIRVEIQSSGSINKLSCLGWTYSVL